MNHGFIVLGVFAIPVLIALCAFLIDYSITYGLQDSGLAKYRRLIRVVGFSAMGVSFLTVLAASIGLMEFPG